VTRFVTTAAPPRRAHSGHGLSSSENAERQT
jgi:hypothetical protein